MTTDQQLFFTFIILIWKQTKYITLLHNDIIKEYLYQ